MLQQSAHSVPSERLRANKNLVLAAVSLSGAALEFASPTLRRDPEVVAAAVSSDPAAQRFALPPDN